METLAPVQDWNLIRNFLAVARAGTLSAAARPMGTSVSTVHRQVAELEDLLGTRLFERRGRRSVLTAAGEALLIRAGRMDDEVHGMVREVHGQDDTLRGVVHLTTTDTFAHGLLLDYLSEFHATYADVRIALQVDNRHYRLGRGEADVALRPGKKPREPDVVAQKVADLAFAFYASADYIERRGRPASPKELWEHDVVAPDASLAGVIFSERIQALTDPARHVLASASILALGTAVERGIGVGALPCFLMDRRADVVRLFPPEREGNLYLAYHVDLRRTARVRAVVNFLKDRLTRDRSLLAGETGTAW